jgi:hypothetical protein
LIALRTVLDALGDAGSVERVVFCCFGAQSRGLRGGPRRRAPRLTARDAIHIWRELN